MPNATANPAAGMRFGRWTVVDPGPFPGRQTFCRCDCGTERNVKIKELWSGGSRSCGCPRAEKNRMRPRLRRGGPYAPEGKRYGHWTLIEDAWHCQVKVLCRCDCGTERAVSMLSLQYGHSKACGCTRRTDRIARQLVSPLIRAGERYGMLVTLEDAPNSVAYVQCRCDCGTEKAVKASNLRNRKFGTRSCGCLRVARAAEATRASCTTHGLSKHPLYSTWCGIVTRTTNPASPSYTNYGARGIRMYEPWRTDPAAFIAWITDTIGQRPTSHTLDRINVDGHYEPGNLRWATCAQQVHNRRSLADLTRERDELRAQVAALVASQS